MVGHVQGSGLLTTQQLREREADAAAAAAQKAAAELKKAREREAAARKAFMESDVSDEGVERLMAAVAHAAERGEHEFLALQFPAKLLTDGGQRINNSDPDWPASLDGLAKRAFEYYTQHLKPLGYRLRAQILDYPGGNLGDAGFFLCW